MYGDLGCTYWMASARAGAFAVGEDPVDDCGIGYVGDDSEGAGALIEVLFGIDYAWAVLIVTGLMVLAPPVWINALGNERAVFPESYPALYSVLLAFGVMTLVSKMDHCAQGSIDRECFFVMTS